MMRFLRRRPGQRGFTLIEMILSLALTSFIGLGASVAIAQVTRETERNSNYTTANQLAMNAVHWIGQDIQMAQTVNGTGLFPDSGDLVLSWLWWDNTRYTITYSLDGGVLRRSYNDGTATRDTVVAEYVSDDPAYTYLTSDNNSFSISVTIAVGAGREAAEVTHTRDIAARPHL